MAYNDIYFAQESAIETGLSGARASLLHLVSARAARRQGLNSVKTPSLTCQAENDGCQLRT